MYYVLRSFEVSTIATGSTFMGAKRVFVDRQAGQVVRIELGPHVNPKMSVEHLFCQMHVGNLGDESCRGRNQTDGDGTGISSSYTGIDCLGLQRENYRSYLYDLLAVSSIACVVFILKDTIIHVDN